MVDGKDISINEHNVSIGLSNWHGSECSSGKFDVLHIIVRYIHSNTLNLHSIMVHYNFNIGLGYMDSTSSN